MIACYESFATDCCLPMISSWFHLRYSVLLFNGSGVLHLYSYANSKPILLIPRIRRVHNSGVSQARRWQILRHSAAALCMFESPSHPQSPCYQLILVQKQDIPNSGFYQNPPGILTGKVPPVKSLAWKAFTLDSFSITHEPRHCRDILELQWQSCSTVWRVDKTDP